MGLTPVLFAASAVVAVGIRAFVNFDRWRYRHQRSDLPWNWRALVGPGAYYTWLASHSEDERD